MPGLIIKDLEQNDELDQQAMRQVVGGSVHMSASVLARSLERRGTFAAVQTRESHQSNVHWSPLLRPASGRR